MSLPANLPHRVDITQTVTTNDEFGGNIDVEQAVASDVDAWVQPASDREAAPFQRRDQNVTHKVYFRGDPGIRPGYTLTPKNGRAVCPFAGATLEVMSVNEATVGTGLLWRAMCNELQPR